MKNVGNKQYLESFKVFPYIAWFIIIVFAIFVYGIAKDLQAVTNQVSSNNTALEAKLNVPIESVTDFKN
jgi:hypothetical protein